MIIKNVKVYQEDQTFKEGEICIRDGVFAGNAEAQAEVALIRDRLKAERGITESLKAADPLRWVQEMNAAKHDAEEMVLREVIYK